MQNKRKILSITRLVVVQSLYQMDMAGTDIDVILKEYKSRVIFDNKDDKMIKDINLNLYKEILTGVYEKQESIDNQIKIFLDKMVLRSYRCYFKSYSKGCCIRIVICS